MTSLPLNEQTLRERILALRALYERGRRRLTSLSAAAAKTQNTTATVDELSHVLADINQAEPMLRPLIEAWSHSDSTTRRRLSTDIAELQQCAASCLALVSSAEQDYAQRRNHISGQLDEGATRNRAVRAYAHAMRQ